MELVTAQSELTIRSPTSTSFVIPSPKGNRLADSGHLQASSIMQHDMLLCVSFELDRTKRLSISAVRQDEVWHKITSACCSTFILMLVIDPT